MSCRGTPHRGRLLHAGRFPVPKIMDTTSKPAPEARRGCVALSLTFSAALLLMGVYMYLHRDIAFRGDAHEIWRIAAHYYDPGRETSFVEYRGPFIFVFFHALQRLSAAVGVDPINGFRGFSALLFAAVSTLLLPQVASALLARPIAPLQRAVFAAVMLAFFGGYSLHPQVDFLAFTAFLAAVCVTLGARRRAGPKGLAMLACASTLFVCACLARFNYIVAAPVLVLLAGWPGSATTGRERVARAAAFVAPLALLLASTPGSAPAGGPSPQARVLAMQLTVGLKVQRIEWNAGDTRFPGGIEVPDASGQRVLDELSRRSPPEPGKAFWLRPPSYVAAAAEFPLTFLGVWCRHLFNGLDIWYDAVYVQDLYKGRIARSLLNYALFFLAGMVAWKRRRAWWGEDRSALAVLASVLLPGLSAVPFVVEVRFFIPVIALAHALAIFGLPLAAPALRNRWLLASLVGFMGSCIALSAHMSSLAGLPLQAPGTETGVSVEFPKRH